MSQYFSDSGWSVVEELEAGRYSPRVAPSAGTRMAARSARNHFCDRRNELDRPSAEGAAEAVSWLTAEEVDQLANVGWESSRIEFSSW